MTSLRERAATEKSPAPTSRAVDTHSAGDERPGDDLPDIEYTGAIATVDVVPVQVAWSRVMADVQSVDKGDRFDGGGQRYAYRGIDRVLNAVGPALRRHGVLVLPVRTEPAYRDVTTSKGNKMRECTVTVAYEIRGPAGDVMPAQSCGEAMDSSDKGTTKACTVAYRNLLITALSIPTRDPRLDPEAVNHDRGEQPIPKASDYRDEATHPGTSLGRLRQMRGEITRHGLAGTQVVNEHGDDEPLLTLIDRIGRERSQSGGAS